MPKNHLYRAVEILGRAVEDIAMWGWTCGALGQTSGPKCVNGSLTMAAGAPYPQYINEVLDQQEPLRMVTLALIDTAPPEVIADIEKNLLENATGDPDERCRDQWKEVLGYWQARGRGVSMTDLGQMLVGINDYHRFISRDEITNEARYVQYFTKETAFAWFERAFDLLAEQLPEPLPVLTVEEIVSTPIAADIETQITV